MVSLTPADALAQAHKQSRRSHGEESLNWQIRQASNIQEPIRQYRFDLKRKWMFDFAWPAVFIAVEIEGAIWKGRGFGSKPSDNKGGAHSHPLGILRDIEKYNAAARAGWRIFRFTTDMIKNGEGLTFLSTINLPKK